MPYTISISYLHIIQDARYQPVQVKSTTYSFKVKEIVVAVLEVINHNIKSTRSNSNSCVDFSVLPLYYLYNKLTSVAKGPRCDFGSERY